MAAITFEPHGGIPTLVRPRTSHSRPASRVSPAVLWRRRVVAVLLALGVLAGAGRVMTAMGGAPLAVSDPTPTASSYVVEPGDTLWEVAERVAPSADPRPVVDALTEARGTSAVSPGETITWVGR